MRFPFLILVTAIILNQPKFVPSSTVASTNIADSTVKTIFAYGGELNLPFLKYVTTLTNKTKPKICLIPTASGDNPAYIASWKKLCQQLGLQSYVLLTFKASSNTTSFREQLLSMDAIVVGTGNAINMMAVWKAQGIDTILHAAYNKGIIIAGGSAGALCWFTNGYTASRPLNLSKFEGLDFLHFSYCPHFNTDPRRKTTYYEGILSGDILPGYACGESCGILFVNGVCTKAISQDKNIRGIYIHSQNGKIREEILPTEFINQ